MAHYHCDINVGVKDEGEAMRASAHYAYITRQGEFEKLRSREELVETYSGNMPTWATTDPSLFWAASDTYERSKGTVYRELEGALPRELTREQQMQIVKAFISRVLRQHPYSYALHKKKASDGEDQPHVHLMWSERILDEHERDPERMFSRAAAPRKDKHGKSKPVDPATGGCRKASMQPRLQEFRALWAELINEAYAKAGLAHRVDHRSLAEQGIERAPEKHLGPVRMRGEDGRRLLDLRKKRKEAELAAAEAVVAMRAGQASKAASSVLQGLVAPGKKALSKTTPRPPHAAPEASPALLSLAPAIGGRKPRPPESAETDDRTTRADPGRARAPDTMSLVERANAGDVEASWELRNQQSGRERRSGRRFRFVAVIHARLEVHADLPYSVSSNGDVTYWSPTGRALFRDTASAVEVIDRSRSTIELALLHALQRFGNGNFIIEGPADFVTEVIETAAACGIDVQFSLPEQNELLASARKRMKKPAKIGKKISPLPISSPD